MQDMKAEKQIEILTGRDFVIRINVDGVCVLRIRQEPGCICEYTDDLSNLPTAHYSRTRK